jgi:DNA-binding NtrC family response regulator
VIKRTLAMTSSPTMQPEDLPEEIIAGAVRRPECSTEGFFAAREQQMAAFEKSYLEQSLRRRGGDVTQASREAKLPRATFYRLMKKHGLNPSDYRS